MFQRKCSLKNSFCRVLFSFTRHTSGILNRQPDLSTEANYCRASHHHPSHEFQTQEVIFSSSKLVWYTLVPNRTLIILLRKQQTNKQTKQQPWWWCPPSLHSSWRDELLSRLCAATRTTTLVAEYSILLLLLLLARREYTRLPRHKSRLLLQQSCLLQQHLQLQQHPPRLFNSNLFLLHPPFPCVPLDSWII